MDKRSVKTTNFLKEYGNRDVFFIKKGFWNGEQIPIEKEMLNTGHKNSSHHHSHSLSFTMQSSTKEKNSQNDYLLQTHLYR